MDRRIVKNYIYNTAYQLLVIITPLVTAPYISRVLHTDGVGLYSYTSTIAAVFALFAGLGFSAYGQREVAYNQDDIYKRSVIFFEIVLFRALLTIIVSIAYIIFCFAFPQYTVHLLPQVFTVLAIMLEMSFYFQGIENFKIIVARNAVVRLFTVICTFLFVKTEQDIGIYIALHAVSTFLCNLLYCALIKKYLVKVKLSELHPLRHTRGSIEFFLPMIAVQIYSYLDKIMLGLYMSTTIENGYYEQARKLTSIIVSVIVALNTVMMSRISSLYAKEEKNQIINHYSQTFSIILMMTMPICAGLLLVSDNFVVWFFGIEFQKVSILMKLSSPLIIFMCIGNFTGIQFLGPTGLQNKMTLAYIIAAIVNITLNALMIPRWASIGAMIASIIAEFISCAIQMYFLLKSEFRFNIFANLWKYIFATIVMSITIIFAHYIFSYHMVIETLSDLVIGVLVYGITLIFLKEKNIIEMLTYLKRKINHYR